MVAVKDRRAHALEQCCEPLLALDIRQLADVFAAIDQQVEGVKGEVGALLLFQCRLQQLKAGLAILADRDSFAVNQAPRR